MRYSGRITVRTMRKHGSDDDLYFHKWADVIEYMKRARRMKSVNGAVSFEISFN